MPHGPCDEYDRGRSHKILVDSLVAAARPAYRDVILASIPLGYWRFDDAGATLADLIGTYNLNGTYINNPTRGVAGAIAGDPNTAVSFNGVNQYASVPYNAAVDLISPLSLEIWVKPVAFNSYNTLMGRGGGSFVLTILGDGKLSIQCPGVAGLIYTTGPLSLNVWQHCGFTRAGVDLRLFVNGVQAPASITSTAAFSPAPGPMTFGADNGGGAAANATLDEAAIYNRALPPAEWLAHYNAGAGLIRRGR
jgi:hypothetical protein